MKTKAAILIEQKRPLEIGEVELPKLGYGQVLVKLKASRICGSQIGEIDGVKGPDRWLPHLLGHEGGGDVLETGPEVKKVTAGDRVVLHWRPGHGIESRSPQYKRGGETVNAGFVTTFNDYAIISENRLTKVPESCGYDLCCLLADTLTTGFGVINNNAKVKIGQSVVIIGVGGIGLGCVLGAKLAGANPIVAVDIQDHKLEKAKQYGATHTINSSKEDLEEAVREIVGDRGADVVTDGTGNPEVIRKAYNLTHEKGCCVLLGVMRHDLMLSVNTLPLHFDKKLIGSEGGSSRPDIEIPRYLRLIEDQGLDLSGFITHRGRLEEVNESISKMRSGEAIHTIIDF